MLLEKMFYQHRKSFFIVFFILFTTSVFAAEIESEIVIEPRVIHGDIGQEITFTITVDVIHGARCPLDIEDTIIELFDLEKVSEGEWIQVDSYLYKKNFTAKITGENPKLRVIRDCPKYGLIVKEVGAAEGGIEKQVEGAALPEVSGRELRSYTLEEVAELYGIEVEDLIQELGVDVAGDYLVVNLREEYGLRPYEVKEAAERVALAPTKKVEEVPRTAVTGHASYFDDAMVLSLLLIGTIAFFMRRFRLRYLTLGVFLFYDFYFREAHLSTVGSPQRLILRLPEILTGNFLEWGILFALPIVFTLLFGRIYCGFVCPYGAYQEFLSFLNKKKFLIPEKIDKGTRYLKYLFLIIVVSGAFFLGDVVGREFDPFKYLFRSEGTTITISLLVALTIASIFIYRPWCKYICPLGAIYALLSKVSSFRIKSKEDLCVDCRLCDKECKPLAISSGEVNSFECLRCGDCLKTCRKAAIEYGWEKKGFIGIGALAIGAIILSFFAMSPPQTSYEYIHKETGQVYEVPGPLGADCEVCHIDGTKRLNPFGEDWARHDRSYDAIASLDSDKDGYPNREELEAGTYPGDRSSYPKIM